MNAPAGSSVHDDEDNNDKVFLDESDIIHEVALDNEYLPDADDESDIEQVGMGKLSFKYPGLVTVFSKRNLSTVILCLIFLLMLESRCITFYCLSIFVNHILSNDFRGA